MLLEQGGASQAAPDILALGADYQGVDTGDFGLRTVGGRVFGLVGAGFKNSHPPISNAQV